MIRFLADLSEILARPETKNTSGGLQTDSKSGFLSFCSVDALGWIVFCWVVSVCPVHCGLCSSVSGLSPLEASCSPRCPKVWQPEMSSHAATCRLGGYCPRTGLNTERYWPRCVHSPACFPIQGPAVCSLEMTSGCRPRRPTGPIQAAVTSWVRAGSFLTLKWDWRVTLLWGARVSRFPLPHPSRFHLRSLVHFWSPPKAIPPE